MRQSFAAVILACLITGPVLAAPPSENPENSAAALAPEDTEAWSNANKAKEALGKGLVERARALAEKAEGIKRTRETAYIRGSVEVFTAIDHVKKVYELLDTYGELAKLGSPNPDAIKTAEKFLNFAAESIDDAKLWKKEVERLDSTYKNLSLLTEGIKAWELKIDEADKVLVTFKELDSKLGKGAVGGKDKGEEGGKVKGDTSLAEVLSAQEWDTQYVTSDGQSEKLGWHYVFAKDGSFTATTASLGPDRRSFVTSEYKGKWTVESRKLTRDEIRALGKGKIQEALPVLTVKLSENKAQYPFQNDGLKANGTFKAIVDKSASKENKVAFISLYCDNFVFNYTPQRQSLILVQP